MDRAAKLAAATKALLRDEEEFDEVPADENRAITRDILAKMAERLGFAPNEIPSAIDQALTDAGVGR